MNRRQASTLALLTSIVGHTVARAEGAPAQLEAPHALSRSEVIADLNLWHQAGLDQYSEEAVREALDKPYQLALARYKGLRQGPAYAAELARVQAQRGETPAVTEATATQR